MKIRQCKSLPKHSNRIPLNQLFHQLRNVEEEKEVILPNGIRYYELKIGGGDMPRRGDLIVIDIMGKVES
ncbi:peptidyl-prolyl cis-trans isomerase FKBP16-2 chloroplastic-like, partial [Trifolium medium]|nr:peptidyl-prolyl cis-trans isomerase FKBP16-2 chloroplastic-like [Trifolium medium]